MTKSKVKTMLVVFSDAKGVVDKEFVPPGQTANIAYYVDVLEILRIRVLHLQKEITTTWVLHHDNAPSHTALCVHELLVKHNVAMQSQPPYRPSLAPGDFFLFMRIKTTLKGCRFDGIEAIQSTMTTALNKVSVEAFQDMYHPWEYCWKKCVDVRGEYFEDF